MTQEQWTRWEPITGLSGTYYLESVLWLDIGFTVTLIHEKQDQRVRIVFENWIDAFRYTNESYYFKLFGDLSDMYGDDFYVNWSFFKVKNSEYLQWLSEKSRTWSDQCNFTHFCILGGDEVIDIVTNYEPTVTISYYDKNAEQSLIHRGKTMIKKIFGKIKDLF